MSQFAGHRMIRHLIRQNPENILAVILAMVSALVFAVGPTIGTYGAFFVAAVGFSVTTQRATSFELALPIHGRALVMPRMLWGICVVLFPIAVWAIAAPLRGTHGEPPMSTIAVVALAAVLGIVLTFAFRPRQRVGLVRASLLAHWCAVFVVGGAALYCLPDIVTIALLGVGTLAALTLVWRSVPASLETARRGASRDSRVWASEPASAPEPLRCAWFLMRHSHVSLSWYSYFMAVLFGVTGSATMLLLGLMQPPYWMVHARLSPLAAMPVSHRTRLLMLLLPNTVGVLLLIGVAYNVRLPYTQLHRDMSWNAPNTYRDAERYYDSPTRVGVEYWKQAENGRIPRITAPWGEGVEPFSFKAIGRTWYNPYSSRRTSSERFIDWQFTRATMAVYGIAIPRAQYPEIDGSHLLPKPRSHRLPVQLLTGGAVLSFMLFTALCFVLGKRHRPGRPWVLRGAEVLVPFLILMPVFALWFMHMFKGGDVLGGIWQFHALALADSLAVKMPLLVLIAFLPAVILYLILEWQFKHAEPSAATLKARVEL